MSDTSNTPRWAAFAGKCRLTSVLAESEAEAREQLEKILQRPGLREIRKRWVECGKVVEPVD